MNPDAVLALLRSSPSAVAVFDRQMRYLLATDAWKTQYKLGSIDLIGRSHYDIFPEIPESWRDKHRLGLNGERLSAQSDRFLRADGTVQYIKWLIEPWNDAQGEIGGIILYTEDVTKIALSLQKNEMLERQLESQGLATEAARMGLFYHNLATQQMQGNDWAKRLFAVPLNSEITLLDIVNKFHPEDAERVVAFMKEHNVLELPGTVEFRVIVEGQTRHYRAISKYGKSASGQSIAYVAMIDISDDVHREEELKSLALKLQEQAHQLELASTVAKVGFFKHILSRDELVFSDSAYEIFGFNRQTHPAVRQDQMLSLMLEEDRIRLSELIGRVVETGTTGNIKLPITSADGQAKVITASFIRETEDSVPVATLVVVTDVTELANTEIKLRELIAKQEQLFAIIGHELRTPASALKMLLEEQNVHSLKPYGEQITETTDHLLSVLDDMRFVTQPGLVKDSPEVESSVPVIIQHTLPLLARLLSEKQLSVEINASAGSDSRCIVREQLLRQTTLNLLRNAALHSEASQLQIQIDAQDLGDSLRFTLAFKDNGKGVPEEDQQRIFNSFERGDTKAEGSGLGLHISRTFARTLMNGDLTYQDNPGGGAVFTLTAVFPKTSHSLQQANERLARLDAQDNLKGLRILFAEDSQVLQMTTVKKLQNQGAEVIAANDGNEAFELAQKMTFDLLLTDIFMPNMDGYKLTEQLLQNGWKQPIIGLTAALVGDEADRLLAAGADAVLGKPLNIAELKDLVSKLLP